jgi:hypothetical protein
MSVPATTPILHGNFLQIFVCNYRSFLALAVVANSCDGACSVLRAANGSSKRSSGVLPLPETDAGISPILMSVEYDQRKIARRSSP